MREAREAYAGSKETRRVGRRCMVDCRSQRCRNGMSVLLLTKV